MPSQRQLLAMAVAGLLVLTGAVGFAAPAAAQSAEGECDYPITVTDATGTEVTINESPDRVVTLAPSAAQTMWEIGAQDKVVGISARGTYLNGTEEKAIISSDEGFASTEKVVAQEPDLVLAPDIIDDNKVQQLRDAGLTVYNFEAASTLADVAEKTRLTGQLTGTCEGAEARATEFEDTVELVRTAVEDEEPPKVLYLLGGEFTAGGETYINDIIETAGGSNVAADAGITGYATISREVVANQSPEYIVISNEAANVIPKTEAYNNTPAVQNGNIITVDANYLNQPAPRSTQVLEDFASAWHPEAYESAAESLDAGTTAVTTETEAPGFGPLVALVAILGAVLLSRREQ